MADEKYKLQLTGQQVEDALMQMNMRIPEGFAVGERDGSPVPPSSQFYENNAKYYAEQARNAAQRAEAVQVDLDAIQEAKETAVAAAEEIEDMTVSSVTLAAGSQATVEKSIRQGLVHLEFGIPTGPQGPQGERGVRGTSAPRGGSAGQVLAKRSGEDDDFEWKTIEGGGGGSGGGRNILDNAWFTINQAMRKEMVLGEIQYYGADWGGLWERPMFDRWRGYASNLDGYEGITLKEELNLLANNIDIWQPFEDDLKAFLNGKTVCGSMKMGGVVYHGSFVYSSTPAEVITICENGGITLALGTDGNIHIKTTTEDEQRVLQAVKLEVGDTSTLEYDMAPDFATELLKCQRHRLCLIVNHGGQIAPALVSDLDGNYQAQIQTPVTRHTYTQVTHNIESYDGVRVVGGGSAYTVTPENISFDFKDYSVMVKVAQAAALPTDEVFVMTTPLAMRIGGWCIDFWGAY